MSEPFGTSDLDPAVAAETSERSESVESGASPDLGDLVIMLLASTLAGLRDRLEADGFTTAFGLVADLVDNCDDYIKEIGK